MIEIWYWEKGTSDRIENPTAQQLADWITALDGVNRNFIHIKMPIGHITILGGKGGRVAIRFRANDESLTAALIYDTQESNTHRITITEDWQVSESVKFRHTFTKERAAEIGAHLLKYQRFPHDLSWHGDTDFSQYQ